MLKKYAPYIVLLFAALLLYWVLTNQRGTKRERVSLTAATVNVDEGFTRNPEKIIYTKHAQCRMECRHINETEVREILQSGKLNANKIGEDERGKTYPLEGKTGKDKFIRIVIAPKKKDIVVVT